MTPAEKLRLACQLDRLGVDIIEAGFPISSDGDFEAVKAVAATVRRPIIAGLARAVTADVECAARALGTANHRRIHVFLATSDLHLRHARLVEIRGFDTEIDAHDESILDAMGTAVACGDQLWVLGDVTVDEPWVRTPLSA